MGTIWCDWGKHNWWHLLVRQGVKGQVWGSIPTGNNLPCEVGGHLGRGVGVHWAADLTLALLGWARRCYKICNTPLNQEGRVRSAAQYTPTPRPKCPPTSQGRLLSVGIEPQTWPLTPSQQERCHQLCEIIMLVWIISNNSRLWNLCIYYMLFGFFGVW